MEITKQKKYDETKEKIEIFVCFVFCIHLTLKSQISNLRSKIDLYADADFP